MVEFTLDLPPRRPADVGFDAPPIQVLQTGEDRRHAELLAALHDVAFQVATLDFPDTPIFPPAPPSSDPLLVAQVLREALQEALTQQNTLTTDALSAVVDRLKVLSKQVSAYATGGSGSGGSSGQVTVTGGQVQIQNAVSLDSTAINAIQESLTNAELRASPVSVSVSDDRTLTERMLAKQPAVNYSLWLDVTSSLASAIYMAEAPVGTGAGTASFRGIRLTLDANGNPLGAVETATGFAWNIRSSANWAS